MGGLRSEKTGIDIGVLAPCSRWRTCKMPRVALGGQFIVERMGNTYWAGTIFCLRCKHHVSLDLFESKDSKVVAPDPQAEQIIGPDENKILEALIG